MEIIGLNRLLRPPMHINQVSVEIPQDHSNKVDTPSSLLFPVTLVYRTHSLSCGLQIG